MRIATLAKQARETMVFCRFFAIAAGRRIGEKDAAFPVKMDHSMMSDAVKAVILGIIEGITEFLPVSSTGHMLLAQRFFGLGEGAFWQSFVILIQLGAILAIVVLYFGKLWRVALGMFTNPDDRRFVIGVLVAFLPAVVVGLAVGKYIKELLFSPWVVCFTLIVGGAILLWVDQLDLKPHEDDATRYPLMMYLWIGIAQCVAMIPGVSRSGASIVAAMLLGADKRSAAEFSFFLAIPTMVGIARKNENSAAERLSAPSSIAATMLAPERDTPGIIARHCAKPIQRYISSGNLVASCSRGLWSS